MARGKRQPTDALLKELRTFGLAYPGAHTKSPWPGHMDLAVNDKTFAYLSVEGEPFGISCKLPRSGAAALTLPFTKPTAYGLGKSGWVSAAFDDGEDPPVDLLKAWIDESYRAQAPKRLSARLPVVPPGSTPTVAPQRPRPKRSEETAKAKAKAKEGQRKRPRRRRLG